MKQIIFIARKLVNTSGRYFWDYEVKRNGLDGLDRWSTLIFTGKARKMNIETEGVYKLTADDDALYYDYRNPLDYVWCNDFVEIEFLTDFNL